MFKIFGSKKKTPEQLAGIIAEALTAYTPSGDSSSKEEEKTTETLQSRVSEVKILLYGEPDSKDAAPTPEVSADVGRWMVHDDLLKRLVARLSDLPFETRKDVAQIFNNLTRNNHANFAEGYLAENLDIVESLVDGYNTPEIALSVGSMLRECIRHPALAKHLLYSDKLADIFTKYVHTPNFEVSSDAFATLKDLLVTHKDLVAPFLTSEFDRIFKLYMALLRSDNYLTIRQSLKLLSELLLDRVNFPVMMRFISDRMNLMVILQLLNDNRPNIQFEAFHVFKVFVANPKKPDKVIEVLAMNRERLVEFLYKFQTDKDDPQFNEEKALLIQTLQTMQVPAAVEEKIAKGAAARKAKAEAAAKAAGDRSGDGGGGDGGGGDGADAGSGAGSGAGAGASGGGDGAGGAAASADGSADGSAAASGGDAGARAE